MLSYLGFRGTISAIGWPTRRSLIFIVVRILEFSFQRFFVRNKGFSNRIFGHTGRSSLQDRSYRTHKSHYGGPSLDFVLLTQVVMSNARNRIKVNIGNLIGKCNVFWLESLTMTLSNNTNRTGQC